MDRFRSLAPFAALAVTLAVAAPALAGSDAAPRAALATDLMEQARDSAFELRRSAARLDSMSGSKMNSTQAHRWELAGMRDDVNRLGVLLSHLEQIAPETTPLQQRTIAGVKTHVQALADAATKAIELKSDNAANRLFPEYRAAVTTIYRSAAELDRMLDAVLDYKEAHARLAEVEASASGAAAVRRE
ncbi:MAG: hypothetical protein U0599_09855 [Vicinamibacteria bacterium]